MIEIVLQAAIDFRLTLTGGAGVILNAQNQLHRKEDPVGLLHLRSRPEAVGVQGRIRPAQVELFLLCCCISMRDSRQQG